MPYQVGFDIGGTFTDFFVVDTETGETIQEKVPTTPEDFSEGAVNGLRKLRDVHDIGLDEIDRLAHGTTVATNALIEREGTTTGLVTTDGFRDIIAIGREGRADLYNHSPSGIPSFVERKYRLGVTERMTHEGEVNTALREDEVIDAIERFEDSPVESVAISLLHSYRNDDHERRIEELFESQSDLTVSRSSQVMPEIMEYERTLSTVINAYIAPIVSEYTHKLGSGLADLDIDKPLNLVQANGGVIPTDELGGREMRLINSGPAGGVIGASRFAEESGIENVITFDMGGTSSDACIVQEGEIATTTNGEIVGIPLSYPQVDIRTIGAGGGSIAQIDRLGVLQVGPNSAGADPGPACYGHGGTQPTVTDAALLLGYLNPGYFLGGEMELDEAAARASLEPFCEELGQGLVELADGILEIATTNMMQAIRVVTVEKGYDPRNFVLTCYGGAGPMFTTRLARELEIERALVPPAPGVLSATGLLTADRQFDYSRSEILNVTTDAVDAINAIYEDLEARAADVTTDDATIVRSVDMRYKGQTFEHDVEFQQGQAIDEAVVEETVERFHEQYRTIYGYAHEDEELEAVTWRLRVIEETEPFDIRHSRADTAIDDAVKGTREVYLGDEFTPATVYDRYELPLGATFEGPALIEEKEATAVIGDETTVTVDETGALIVELH